MNLTEEFGYVHIFMCSNIPVFFLISSRATAAKCHGVQDVIIAI